MIKKYISIALSLSVAVLTLCTPIDVKAATQSLTVDCDNVIRSVTHCASGSLYGINETTPADISTLVTPLNPNVFTNPARAGSEYQQPTGAAIDVAERLYGNSSGEVMIRLADICPNWPYSFPGMSTWLDEVETVITDKLNSSADNFYGYEIWNEPVYTWDESTNGSFYTLWENTYDLIRLLDPNEKIIGPSDGYYDHDRMYNFLAYCVSNDCVPDIICWHELSSNGSGSYISDFVNNYNDYRSIEDSLGISDRPISINEYCDIDHTKEGCPGSAARYIAKYERYSIDSACISWWWTAYPGRLGSLLGTDYQKGAGWWFYKWYGDMSGNMVVTVPSNEESTYVDGFACVDSSEKYISVMFGGDNDGDINITLNDLPSWIGSTATVRVEAIDWVSKDSVSTGPYTISAANYDVNGSSITVSLSGCNSTSGYRLLVLPGVSSSQTRYEAENAIISNANTFYSANASNNYYVGQIDYDDSTTPVYSYVDFLVCAPSSGTYTLSIRYANGSGATSTQGLAYNNGAWQTISYEETDGWAQFATKNVQVSLNEGINVIRLAKGSPYFEGGTYYAEIDYIEISQ